MSYLAIFTKGDLLWRVSFFHKSILYQGKIYAHQDITTPLYIKKGSDLRHNHAEFSYQPSPSNDWIMGSSVIIYHYDFIKTDIIFGGKVQQIYRHDHGHTALCRGSKDDFQKIIF